MNNIRLIRNIIYALKRRIGHSVSILTTATMTQNLQTGVIDRDERVIKIRRAIVVTAREIRDFSYDLSFIAANKNFTYGGLYDQSIRIMIFDGRDLPSDYEPSLNDRCIYNNTRWQFRDISPTAEKVGWLIKTQRLLSQTVENVVEQDLQNNIPEPEQSNTPWLT